MLSLRVFSNLKLPFFMKQTLLLFTFWFALSGSKAQSKPPADGANIKLKRSTEIVRIPEAEEKSVTVYPNPTNGVVNLSLAGFNGKKTTLSVVNVIGTVIYHEILHSVDGRITKAIDLGKFANGLYYIKLEAEDYSEIRKIVLK
jgi:hypothetical protein